MDSVREQYERYPYPPVSALALPSRGQGDAVRFEVGTKLCFGEAVPSAGIRILVAGGGTLEPLVVAEANPTAASVTAVDLSQESLSILGRREKWASALRLFRGGHAPIATVCADLFSWDPEQPFDVIFASNILQHVADPAALLRRLSGWLKPEGIMRISTYPKQSRIWMRETGRWLRLHHLAPGGKNLRARALAAVWSLPHRHPVRSCFLSHQEIGTDAGIVDAFLHACENPLSPLDWQEAIADAGLELRAETQTDTSRSTFLDDIVPEASALSPWLKLEVLDQLLELCANPTLWLARGSTRKLTKLRPATEEGAGQPSLGETLLIPSRVRYELRVGLERAAFLAGLEPAELLERFSREVGPRVSEEDSSRELPGLAIVDYPAAELLKCEKPWSSEVWTRFDEKKRLHCGDVHVPGTTLAEQAAWLQVRYGALTNAIDVMIR